MTSDYWSAEYKGRILTEMGEVIDERDALRARLAEAQRLIAALRAEMLIVQSEQLRAERQRDDLARVCEDATRFVVAWANNHPPVDGEPSKIAMRLVKRMREAIEGAPDCGRGERRGMMRAEIPIGDNVYYMAKEIDDLKAQRDELVVACEAAVALMESYEFKGTIPHQLCTAALAAVKGDE